MTTAKGWNLSDGTLITGGNFMVDGTGKVTFTEQEQAEVDRLMGERLAREGVQDNKEIVELLHELDITGTPAEVKAAIKIQAEQYKQQKAEAAKQTELEALKAQAQETGASPVLLAKIKELETKLADIDAERQAKKTEEEKAVQAAAAKKVADEAQKKSWDEAAEAYGEDTLNKLSGDEDFLDYVAGKIKVPIKTLVERFMKIKGKAYEEGLTKANSKAVRSSGSGGAALAGGTYGLSKEQLEDLKQYNARYPKMAMSAKEYKEMLGG
jgi:hypothetical protein